MQAETQERLPQDTLATAAVGAMDATDLEVSTVVRFLSSNTDFFLENPDVLTRLRIPHETGQAVSLIEKQVSVLRNKCSALEHSLRELIGVARENEQLHGRLHKLIQDIISARSLSDVAALVRDTLLNNFKPDDVRLLLVRESTGMAPSEGDEYTLMSSDDPGLALFTEIFAKGETRCGELTAAQKSVLFGSDGEDGQSCKSAAVIPLVHNRNLGLIVLGSKDAERFASGKGVMFLNQLGEVLSRRFDALLTDGALHEEAVS